MAVLPRVAIVEGRRTAIFERKPPLPTRLDQLLKQLRVYPIRIQGWRSQCGEQDHRLVLFADGALDWPDERGIVASRQLKVFMCQDCESVQVRDVSLDRMARMPLGRLAPRRRDHVIGWYSGARRNQQQFR